MTASPPTLDDVARAAGVSTATVSRCLNSPDKVSAKTRDTVMETVARLSYAPNFGARVMVARRTHTIGAIIPTMENAIFARGLQAFQEELVRHGYHLLVASSSYQPELEAQQINSLVARGAEGLLLIGQDRHESANRFLQQRNTPVVTAWTSDQGCAVSPSVGFNNRKAMYDLTNEVIRLGHRHIGVISAETAQNDRARARVNGIREAIRANGLAFEELPVVETRYGIDQGAAAFREIMSQHPQLTAVMCGNDVLAVGAAREARDMGLVIGTDLSITGFDDLELSRVVTPPITTVHVPHRDMGRNAAERLIALIEGQSGITSLELPTSLCLRASLGPPRML